MQILSSVARHFASFVAVSDFRWGTTFLTLYDAILFLICLEPFLFFAPFTFSDRFFFRLG